MAEETEIGFPSEEVSFIGEEYKGSSGGYGFREIIMTQISRIAKLASKEFIGGYWETRFDPKGNEHKKYIPDSRMEYANAIDVLFDLLEPHIENEDIKNAIKKIEEDFEEEIKNLIDEDTIFAKDQDSVIIYSYKRMKSRRMIFKQLNEYLNSADYFKSGEAVAEG